MLTPPGFSSTSERDFPDVVSRVLTGPRKAFASTNMANNRDGRELVQEVLSVANGGYYSWTCPLTTASLVMLRGAGGIGQPRTNYTQPAYTATWTSTAYFENGYVSQSSGSEGRSNGSPPASGCQSNSGNPGSGILYSTVCYTYSDASYYVEEPEQYGGSATAFGVSFDGGYGYFPSYQTREPLEAIVPGKTYQFFIPRGGAIVLDYYK